MPQLLLQVSFECPCWCYRQVWGTWMVLQVSVAAPAEVAGACRVPLSVWQAPLLALQEGSGHPCWYCRWALGTPDGEEVGTLVDKKIVLGDSYW